MTLDVSQEKRKIDKKPKSMTLAELRREKTALQELLVDTSKIETEYYRKITWAFSPLVFVLIGFPLAVITNKREKSANVIMAIICAAVYYLMSLGCEALSLEKLIPAVIIMWGPNVLGGIAGFILNFRLLK